MEPTPTTTSSKKGILLIIVILIVLALLLGGWYFLNQKQTSNSDVTNTTPPAATSGGNSAPPGQTSYEVKVYFGKHPDSDDDPTKVFPVTRTGKDLGLAKFALEQLIAGPTPAEKTAGYYSSVKLLGASNCEGEDFTITIISGKATVKFCKQVEALGVIADGRATVQLETTLKQFSTVNKVVLLTKDNNCLFDESGLDRCKQ